jgi:hypothetical protein
MIFFLGLSPPLFGVGPLGDPSFRQSSQPGLKSALLPTLYASSHAANLLLLHNGDVLCFCDREGSANPQLPKRSVGAEFSYPSILQLPDGKILVAYTCSRQAIKAVLFSEAWVQEVNTIGKFGASESKTSNGRTRRPDHVALNQKAGC